MGKIVEITNVDKVAGTITFTENGESNTFEVILPAKIQWARQGKAEIGYSGNGVNFIKSLEPKTQVVGAHGFGNYSKPYTQNIAISTMEFIENATLKEVKAIYDHINSRSDAKCAASNLFKTEKGYDAVFYVTTFKPKVSSEPAKQESSNYDDMIGENPEI